MAGECYFAADTKVGSVSRFGQRLLELVRIYGYFMYFLLSNMEHLWKRGKQISGTESTPKIFSQPNL